MTTVDVRADGDDAYLVVLAPPGQDADALAGPDQTGEVGRPVRLVVPEPLLAELGLTRVDAPRLARAAATLLADEDRTQDLADEVSLAELARTHEGFLERTRLLADR